LPHKDDQIGASEVLIIQAASQVLIPREHRAGAMRLEGWPQTPVQAAILRDAREERAPQDEVGARLDMISFKESLN
jgi:hypothetical protein